MALEQLLYQAATAASPFLYLAYFKDVEEIERVHPIALYRRLAEPNIARRKIAKEIRNWQECIEKWEEELGAREKTQVGRRMSSGFLPPLTKPGQPDGQ